MTAEADKLGKSRMHTEYSYAERHGERKGYGTQSERLAVKYAFDELGMVAVNADTIITNTRSQHVLEKVGFHFIGEDGTFKYYRLER